MLSTQYRLRLEGICKSIAANQEVGLDDMIWAEKLAKANTSARGMLSSARRLKTDEDSTFLKYLDIGDSDPRKHKKGFGGADDIADWFKNDKRSDDWRQRDQISINTYRYKIDMKAFNTWVLDTTIYILDFLYRGRDFQRFWVLEVIARAPYFSFILSLIHI